MQDPSALKLSDLWITGDVRSGQGTGEMAERHSVQYTSEITGINRDYIISASGAFFICLMIRGMLQILPA